MRVIVSGSYIVIAAAFLLMGCTPPPIETFTVPQDKEQCEAQPDNPWCE